MRLWTALALLLASSTGALADGERPCITLSRAAAPPTIDGKVGRDEWAGAAAVSGFAANGAAEVAAPGTTAFLAYDDRALYVAFRCAEPDPARPRGFVRAHDDRAFEDDCVQVVVAPEDLRKAKPGRIAFGGYAGAYGDWFADIQAYYEFTLNCRGSRMDARNDVRDWSAPWAGKVGREPGAWTAEMAIAWKSLGLEGAPTGNLCGLNLFRSRQPELSGWICTPFGGYTPLPLGAMLLAEAHPVARMLAAAPPRPGENALAFTLSNPTAAPVEAEVTVTSAGSPAATESITVPPAGVRDARVSYRVGDRGRLDAAYVVRVRGEDVPLLSGSLPLRLPGALSLDLRTYALARRVEGCVTLGPGSKAVRAVLSLQGGGGPAETTADLKGRPGAILRLPLSAKPGSTVEARLRVVSADGTVLGERTDKTTLPERPSWIGTRAGLVGPGGRPAPRVLPPWTPMRVQGKSISLLGRKLTFGDLALPAAITSAGKEVLAAPARVAVAAGGREVAWQSRSFRVAESAPDHVRVESLWRGPGLDLRVTSTLEYDGFCWNEVTLLPRGRARVERVALELPLRPEVCRYAYRGFAQAAHAISPLGLRAPLGSSLWIGDEERGIAWLAEGLEWVQSRDRSRQVEILPGPRRSVWRSTFIDTPTELKSAYTARFALQVTPAKPVPLRKSRIFHGAGYGMEAQSACGRLQIPARANLDLARGSLEFWLRPAFDTNEAYSADRDRSAYNREFLYLASSTGEILMLYYNADDRSLRLVTRNAAGAYPVILSGASRLPAGEWSYVGLSWGDKLRLSINGQVAEREVRGTLSGDLGANLLNIALGDFQIDDLRISSVPRDVSSVPSGPFTADADTLFLHPLEDAERPAKGTATGGRITAAVCADVPGKWGKGLAIKAGTRLDQLAAEGKRVVIYHEDWSRYQGYPDLAQAAKLKKLADGCHARGMLFLVYFCQLMSDAAPEWPGMRNDFMALPERCWYHRDDVKQDCYVSCVNGPYGDLLLDGIAKLADQAGIDGVYMDGTTVPWDCTNPTHPGCGEAMPDGTYRAHQPIRATRRFMQRLRAIFVTRRKAPFLDAHTGGAINIATQSFCDGYYDGEHLARYKPGYRLSPDIFAAAYTGRQWGFRGEFLPNRHSMDEALAVALVHDTAVRSQPAAVDRAWAPYEDAGTRYVPYWEKSPLYSVTPAQVLGSLYLKSDRALLVLGSQTEAESACTVSLAGVLSRLPRGAGVRDAITGEALACEKGVVRLALPGRSWRMLEIGPR